MTAPVEVKRGWIEPGHGRLGVGRQCELAGLCRSSYYYEPASGESPENLALMRQIDRIYTRRPFYGSPRITRELRRTGQLVTRKRVARLMRLMGLQSVVPGPHTSRGHPQHPVYPYLLRGRSIQRPMEVWCADITFVPLEQGYMYLVAVMDWHSRYVVSWEISNTLEGEFCVTALERALARGRPEIFNTDQGTQFTSTAWIQRLQSAGVRISMDGRGRAMDNVFVERLWWSVKHENIYLYGYRNGLELRKGLQRYFRFYNRERQHSGLEDRTPQEVHRWA